MNENVKQYNSMLNAAFDLVDLRLKYNLDKIDNTDQEMKFKLAVGGDIELFESAISVLNNADIELSADEEKTPDE